MKRVLGAVSSAGLLLLGVSTFALALGGAPFVGPSWIYDIDELAADTEDLATDEVDAITVTAARQRGLVIGDIEPELVLDASDIEAYGVGSLAELLAELTAETGSGRGRGGERPVVLLNGRRVSGFREIGQYPPEALERVEVLPEEVALKYGFRADQRVINFVLKPNITVMAVEIEAEMPTQGGRTLSEGSVRRLWVNDDQRWSLDASYIHTSPILESERDIAFDPPGDPFSLTGNIGPGNGVEDGLMFAEATSNPSEPITVVAVPLSAATSLPTSADFLPGVNNASTTDDRPFRTLVAESEELAAGFSYSQKVFGETIGTLSGRLEQANQERRLSLAEATFDLPSTSPFSPFSNDGILYRYEDSFSPLRQETETLTSNVGLALNSKPGEWTWSVTAAYDSVDQDRTTDIDLDIVPAQALIDAGDIGFNPYGDLSSLVTLNQQETTSLTQTAQVEGVVNGVLARIPVGEITSTLKAGVQTRDQESTVRLGSEFTETDLSRDQSNLQLNVDIPLTTRDDDHWTWLGGVTANGNIAVDDLSDVGTLTTYGYGLNWRLNDMVRFLISFTDEEGAPSLNELGDPLLDTPNVDVFDFTTGQNAEVTLRTGGNPDLEVDTRQVLKLGMTLKPLDETDVTLNLNYTDSQIENEARAFPAITADIINAFPDRFVREGGTLTFVDRRPINVAETNRRQLRTGLSYRKRLGPARGGPGSGGGRPPAASPPSQPTASSSTAASGRPQMTPEMRERLMQLTPAQREQLRALPREERRAFLEKQGIIPPSSSPEGSPTAAPPQAQGRPQMPRRGGRPGSLRASINHVWWLEENILIADGIPELDLLNGSALGNEGGQPEHTVEASGFYWNKGLGARARLNWQAGTDVFGEGTNGSSDLSFSSLTTLDFRVTYDLQYSDRLMAKAPWLKGTRLAFDVENLFDEKLDFRDANGDVPFTYQPDLLDPVGRVIEFEIRKRF